MKLHILLSFLLKILAFAVAMPSPGAFGDSVARANPDSAVDFPKCFNCKQWNRWCARGCNQVNRDINGIRRCVHECFCQTGVKSCQCRNECGFVCDPSPGDCENQAILFGTGDSSSSHVSTSDSQDNKVEKDDSALDAHGSIVSKRRECDEQYHLCLVGCMLPPHYIINPVCQEKCANALCPH